VTVNMVLVIEGEGLQPCKVLSVCGGFCTDFVIGQLLADAADFLQHCKVCFCHTHTHRHTCVAFLELGFYLSCNNFVTSFLLRFIALPSVVTSPAAAKSKSTNLKSQSDSD